MTYIAAFKNPGFASIISDMRVTWSSKEQKCGYNTALKTGILFCGCIFGLSGNLVRGREFILAVKAELTKPMTPAESWYKFNQIVSNYNFRKCKNDHFQAILSTRASGTPELLLLDSMQGLHPFEFDHGWVSIGSGKPFLDKFVTERCIPEIKKFIEKHSHLATIYPYILCLKFIEISESFERKHLEKFDVGGLFHFIYQTDMLDATQDPALYVLSAADLENKTVYTWLYRICRVHNGKGLLVDKWAPSDGDYDKPVMQNKRFMSFDSITWPEMPQSLNESFKNHIIDKVEEQPWYFFCGFGFTNPTHRKTHAFHFTTKGDFIISKNLKLDPRAKQIIANNFEKVIKTEERS